ncbi:glutathione S-transferase N-terminal domain-containing protein [Legionella sp. W05-934-2]|jgi:GST-like protein|uniref:glutathione S-transferase N-terminal domain-containing protein n=1 Tax=Legionella sp. W05-934-2 TaxID=1198649 RepID=UPI0034630131
MYLLYSFNTPNGLKPTILLEELGVDYKIKIIDIREGEQFKPEFLKISPNNKIPALVDEETGLSLFESVAILQYLAEKHGKFLPTDLTEKFKVMPWCYFQVGHVGPMFGQFGHFHKFAKEDVPYAKKRYAEESMRIMGVMERQLATHEFISGEHYTIADMAIWPWIYGYQRYYESGIDKKQFPSLTRWYEQIGKRKAVKAALAAYE